MRAHEKGQEMLRTNRATISNMNGRERADPPLTQTMHAICIEKHPHNFRNMSDMTITETIYIAKDRDGNCRYVGRTKLPLARRRQLHAEQLRTDWLACPLYRFMHDEGAIFGHIPTPINPTGDIPLVYPALTRMVGASR